MKTQQEYNNEFVVPDNIPDLWDKCAELWDKIADEKDKTNRAELIKKHNLCAKAANKLQGHTSIIIITAKTKVLKNVDPGETLAVIPGGTIVKTAFVKQGRTGAALQAQAAKKKTKIITTILNQPGKGKKATKTAKPKKEAAAKVPRIAGEPKAGSIIDQILTLHKQGKSNKEIVEAGFNKHTVNRQVNEYKKRNANAKSKK